MDLKGTMYCAFLIVAVFVGFNYLNASTEVFASFDLVDEIGLQGGELNGNLSFLNLFISDLIFFITSSFSQITTFFTERINAVGKEIMAQYESESFTNSILIISLIPFFPFIVALVKPYKI